MSNPTELFSLPSGLLFKMSFPARASVTLYLGAHVLQDPTYPKSCLTPTETLGHPVSRGRLSDFQDPGVLVSSVSSWSRFQLHGGLEISASCRSEPFISPGLSRDLVTLLGLWKWILNVIPEPMSPPTFQLASAYRPPDPCYIVPPQPLKATVTLGRQCGLGERAQALVASPPVYPAYHLLVV